MHQSIEIPHPPQARVGDTIPHPPQARVGDTMDVLSNKVLQKYFKHKTNVLRAYRHNKLLGVLKEHEKGSKSRAEGDTGKTVLLLL